MAARDRGRPRHARGPRGRRDPLHDPRAAPGAAHVRVRASGEWERDPGRGGSTRRGPTASPLPSGRAIAVFFYDGPVSRAVAFEGPAVARRAPGRAPASAAFDDARERPAARAHRHRRRDLRPPPPPRRHGARLRAPHDRDGRAGAADELRRVSRAAPADARRSEIVREHLLELRPRRRALAERLRLPHGGAPGWRQDWRAPAARGARLAARRAGARSTRRPRRALRATPGRRATTTSTWSSTARRKASPGSSGATRPRALEEPERIRGAEAAGDAAARAAHVHELRLVLRRHRRHRDRARSSSTPGGRSSSRGSSSRARISRRRFSRRSRGRRATSRRPATAAASTRTRSARRASSLERVAAHYAVHSLFTEYADTAPVYCYRVEREDYRTLGERPRPTRARAGPASPRGSPRSRSGSSSASCISGTTTSPAA